MLIVLPVLSFACTALLAVFLTILLRRPTLNTSNISIALWFLLGNLVHAVNALVWASNVEARIPVWCDIVTKLMLGVTIALPGVCVCSARYLELLSSTRKIYPNTYSKRLHTLLDVALCYVLPLLYMTLHFAVQDHRFDLVQDFGCSASIHRSTPAVFIMIIPPLILCSISLVLCMCSIWNCTRLSSSRLDSHLSARSSLSAPLFIRRLAKSALLTTAVLITTLFPLLSPRTERFAAFRANFNIIFVVRQRSQLTAAQMGWWTIPVLSLVYLLLSLVLGDELGDALAWIRRCIGRPAAPKRPARPELSRLTFNHAMASKSSLVAPSLTTPQAVQLRSGWDGMLDVKRTRRGFLPSLHRKSVVSSADSSDYSPSPSPSPDKSSLSPTTPADDAFTSSTLTYLASPVAQALGLPSPIASPAQSFASTLTREKSTRLLPPRQPIPEDTASTISSIWDSPWPLPPAAPSPVPMHLPRRMQTQRAHSPAPSDDSCAYPMYSPVEPPATPPFEGSGVPGRGAPPPRRAQSVPRKGVVRALQRTWSREALARGYAVTDVIYMTRTVEERAS
ncbi:pheromone A receptor-domain-containing protein [Mycena vulgaris]|nr:pheromone A receptor-domain-containing protein [Mycena vulgaris]